MNHCSGTLWHFTVTLWHFTALLLVIYQACGWRDQNWATTNQSWLSHMLNAFCDHCHTKSLSFDIGLNASTSYKEEQHVAFRTGADTIAQPWLWVLPKHDFRSRKLFEGQTTKELTAKNLWARKMWKVILSCVFHNKTPSVTYPANSSEFTAENAGGYLLPLHRGSKPCTNAMDDADEWHTLAKGLAILKGRDRQENIWKV